MGKKPTLGKRTIFPKLKGVDRQQIEYLVECNDKKNCGYITVSIKNNGMIEFSSASSSDHPPSSYVQVKKEDTPKGGNGKLKFQKK